MKVDPFVITWPQQWINDPEIAPVLNYLNRFLHDLWVRTGGGNDEIDDLQDLLLGSDSRRITEVRQLTKRVRQLELELDSMKKCQPKPKKDITEQPNLDASIKKLSKRITQLELTVN